MHRSTTRSAARNLWNHKARKLQFRMLPAELDQRLRHLLRRADSHVSNHAPAQALRIIKVDDVLREVGAVTITKMKVRSVWRRIVGLDKSFVLRHAGFNFKSISRA